MRNTSKFLSAVSLSVALLSIAGCSSPPIDTEQMLTDKDVTDKTKMAIYSDPLTKNGEITVHTVRGIVHLKGSVSSQEAMDRAVEHARRASGSMGVKNELIVR